MLGKFGAKMEYKREVEWKWRKFVEYVIMTKKI